MNVAATRQLADCQGGNVSRYYPKRTSGKCVSTHCLIASCALASEAVLVNAADRGTAEPSAKSNTILRSGPDGPYSMRTQLRLLMDARVASRVVALHFIPSLMCSNLPVVRSIDSSTRSLNTGYSAAKINAMAIIQILSYHDCPGATAIAQKTVAAAATPKGAQTARCVYWRVVSEAVRRAIGEKINF